MVRKISMDIREGREHLKQAAEESLNAILELDLQGKVKWASATWQDLTGVRAAEVLGKPMIDVAVDEEDVFANCLDSMRKDDSKSRIVRFSVRKARKTAEEDECSDGAKTPVSARDPSLNPLAPADRLETKESTVEDEGVPEELETVALEAQGIMVYDRETGAESHTMWMVKPAVSRQITIDLPDLLVESLGIGAEMLANYLTELADVGANNPENHPPPLPVLCRICERQITPWWFERHTELCAQDHRAEMEVQMTQEALNEQRSALVKVLDALEAQSQAAKPTSDAGSPLPAPRAEYKNILIGSLSNTSSGTSSRRVSPVRSTAGSRDSAGNWFSHNRARSFAVRRPIRRIVELVLDLCDTAMEISTPAVKEQKASMSDEIRTQSPQSENHIQQVLQWQSPSSVSLENEDGLALLCMETEQLTTAKLKAVFRHRSILEYSERIRIEAEVLVSECIETATQKAARIKAGDLSDSDETSSSESEEEAFRVRNDASQSDQAESVPSGDLPQGAAESSQDASRLKHELPQSTAENEELKESATRPASVRSDGGSSTLAMAFNNVSEASLDRVLPSIESSRTNSPNGARTPKSVGAVTESMTFSKRNSVVLESDTGADSDSSRHSSIASGSHWRSDSPSAEMSLSRVQSTRSRERKRRSLILPSLANVHRRQSPARGSQPPASPFRSAKSRVTSASESMASPILSPTLMHQDLASPKFRAREGTHHHRRQSSTEVMGRPLSPRVSMVMSNPQPRAPQTSIKDFEIIKPISRGAFGSVYLSKKKSTGDYYAIKVLKKADMVAKNQVTNVKAERAIMMWQGESDFVAKLYWTFSSKDYLYLVMEYLNGGDCASLIKVLGALPEDWTKKYMGEVVLCVQHLHSRQIVHRDLKPDNFLVDAKGHLKLTDFGLSRMGLIGRQKRAINAEPEDAPPDLLKAGPFRRAPSGTSSRSTSFDYQGPGQQSPALTPVMTSSLCNEATQPSYFALNRDSSASREPTRRASAHRSDSGDGDSLVFRRLSVADAPGSIEEEAADGEYSDSPDANVLQHVKGNYSVSKNDVAASSTMPPPMMALFDPEDSNRRFVGTPDYLAPETINGAGQDEMSDWWSLGCILFECLYGHPPFNANTPQEVFNNILSRNIHWPSEEDSAPVSEEAKDLMNRLMCIDPKERLGSNKQEKYADGGEEIKAHPWFADVKWDTLREDEASFVPVSENPENTEYFDARGATMQNCAAEFEDQGSSPAPTPGADYPDRPHDALSRVRSQVNQVGKRNLMPLHIPAHVRNSRSRRLSEPAAADDFGNFQFKNLSILEKANKDVIQKLRENSFQCQAKTPQGTVTSSCSAVASPSPAPSLESSPVLPVPLKRALSTNRASNRPQSPSLLSQAESSPSRASHPPSPLMVSFSAGQSHERRKTSSGSSSLSHSTSNPSSLQPGAVLDHPMRLQPAPKTASTASSPAKSHRPGPSHVGLPNEGAGSAHRQSSATSPRQRSHTVGSQESDLVPHPMSAHYKRRSGMLDVSPSSSDNEETRQHKTMLRVHRRRVSSRRLSQINPGDGPAFRSLDVLVCEDHPVSRLVMERLLEKSRCRTISVTNGSEAIRYAMSDVKFDIIMLEYKLPHLNGTDVARMIRDTKNANTNTPIVAVTGYLKELQAPHYFDALIEKPPTKEKLEDIMSRLCNWKAAPDGWKPTPPQNVPRSSLRQESFVDGSPTTTNSSGLASCGPGLASSWTMSSRGDSIGSSQLGLLGEDDGRLDGNIPVIISRSATSEWDQSDLERNFGGLGITSPITAEPKTDRNLPPAPIALDHQVSAPASLAAADSTGRYRKPPTTEAIHNRRRSHERLRSESAAESGDDEDEDLGNHHIRVRSPNRHVKRSSKLGTEMMRTNSQGSVVSLEDIAVSKEVDKAAKESSAAQPIIDEESALEVENNGHLTPPETFAIPGNHTEIIVMDARPEVDPFATPRPQTTLDPDPDPTPKAPASPSRRN